MSYSYSGSETFTVTNARAIASKVATDLKRMQNFYGSPSDVWIDLFEAELVILLKRRVLDHVVYGFQRRGAYTPASLRYRALADGTLATDDDPGKIRPGLDVAGASFASFLEYGGNWHAMSSGERNSLQAELPFARGDGREPALESGYWSDDHNYLSGGRGLGRSVVRV